VAAAWARWQQFKSKLYIKATTAAVNFLKSNNKMAAMMMTMTMTMTMTITITTASSNSSGIGSTAVQAVSSKGMMVTARAMAAALARAAELQ